MKYTAVQYYIIVYLLLSSLSKILFSQFKPGTKVTFPSWMEYEKSLKLLLFYSFFIFEIDFVYYTDMFLKSGGIFVLFVRLAYPEIETLFPLFHLHALKAWHGNDVYTALWVTWIVKIRTQ